MSALTIEAIRQFREIGGKISEDNPEKTTADGIVIVAMLLVEIAETLERIEKKLDHKS